MQMENRIRFGSWEAVMLIMNLVCTKLFLHYSRMTAEDAGNAGWLSSIVSCTAALIMFAILLSLYRRFEDKDIVDIAEIAGGKFFRTITGAVITVSLFLITVVVLRKFTEDMKIVSLPISPLSYVMFFFIIGIVVSVFFGLESIMRYHAIVIPVIAAGYITILLGVIPRMDITNLSPFFGTGLDDIVQKGLLRSSIFGELLVLFLIPPFLGSYKKLRSVGYISFAFCSFFLITGSLAYILSFPYPSSLEPFLPVYNMARSISLGRFFQRIESLFVFIWAMGALMYLSATFYFMVYIFAKTTRLKYIRPLVLPFAVIVFSVAFIPDNLIEVIKIESNYINNFAWLISFVYIGLILIIAVFRKRSGTERCRK